jgi:hypothetical protein
MYKLDNEKVKAMSKIVALMLSDKRKYLALIYHYCLQTPLSDIKIILGKSYAKTKNSLSRANKVYDIDLLCSLSEDVIEYEAKEVFKEVNGRYKCKWCGRYITKRGRTQHLLKYHAWEIEEIAKKYLLICSETSNNM